MWGVRRLKAVTAAIITASVLAVVAAAYSDCLRVYAELMKLEEYSYLVVLAPLVLGVFTKLVIDEFSVAGLNVPRFFASLMFTSVSILTYVLGDVVTEYSVEFKVLSLVFFVWAAAALFLMPEKALPGVLAMLSLLLLVPVPRAVLDYVSAHLTSAVADLAAWFTGASLIESAGRVVLAVRDVGGVMRFFEVSLVCSGVVSLTSTLAVAPLVSYLIYTSVASRARKLAALATSLAAAAATVFVGNLLRLVAVVLATRYWSYEAALTVFHQVPSLIYVAVAVALAVYICSKLPRARIQRGAPTKVRVSAPTVAWVASVAVLALITASFIAVVAPVAQGSAGGAVPAAVSLAEFLKEPALKVFNATGAELLSDVPSPYLSEALGVPAIRKVALRYGSYTFTGYVEVAEVPSRFHGWYVCLTLQGYRIIKSWSEVGNVTVNYLLLSKSGGYFLLGYSIYKYLLQGIAGATYVRVSLITPVTPGSYGDVAAAMSSLLRSIGESGSATGEPLSKVLDYVMVAANAVVLASIALITISVSKTYIMKLINAIRRR